MFDGFLLHLYQSMLILKRGTQHPLQWESQLSHLVGHQLLQSCWAKVRGFQGCFTMETSTFSHSIGFPGKCSLYSILWVWKNGISLGNCKSFGNNHCQKWGNDGKLDRVYYLSWDHRHRLLLWQARGSLPNRPPSSLDEYPPCPFLRLDPWTSVSAGLPLAGIQVADVPSLRSLPEELWENHQIHRFNVWHLTGEDGLKSQGESPRFQTQICHDFGVRVSLVPCHLLPAPSAHFHHHLEVFR